jgi:hypothetical protein
MHELLIFDGKWSRFGTMWSADSIASMIAEEMKSQVA